MFWAKLLSVEQFIEEPFDDFNARVDKCLILAYSHLSLHEREDAIFREGWEDIPRLFFGKDLSRISLTS